MKEKNKEKYLEGTKEGYKSFGAYELYKSTLINKLFGITAGYTSYSREYWNCLNGQLLEIASQEDIANWNIPTAKHQRLLDKNGECVEQVKVAQYSTPDQFRLFAFSIQQFIRLLKPKIAKIEKSLRPKYSYFDETLMRSPDELLLDLKLMTQSYELLVQLLEELGYTDMSIQSDIQGDIKF